MQQSKLESLIEAIINVSIGFYISVVANWLIFPLVGVYASGGQILWIGFLMTIISVVRSYIVRRWAQKYLTKTKAWVIEFLKEEVK